MIVKANGYFAQPDEDILYLCDQTWRNEAGVKLQTSLTLSNVHGIGRN